MVTLVQKCVSCGSAVTLVQGPLEWDVKGQQIVVENVEYGLCSSCGEVYIPGGSEGCIHRRAVDIYKKNNGLLSGEEVRVLRQSLGLSQAKFEKMIGAGPKTVVRWENGSVFQNRTADTLMRIIRSHRNIAEELMRGIPVD